MTSCAGFLPNITGGSNTPTYDEDLSLLRPEIEEVNRMGIDSLDTTMSPIDSAKYHMTVNDTVNMVLDSISSQRLLANKVTGHTILVYSSMSREDARKAIGRLYKVVPDAGADLQFQQPFFRVKVGKFLHEYHAHPLLNSIKSEFPNAIIIPETYKIVQPDEH